MRYLTIIYLLSAVFIQAQKLSVVKGTIRDKTTNSPLPAVYIIYDTNRFVVSDQQGNYQFKTTSGYIEVIYKFIGYKTQVEKHFLKENDSLIINIYLEAENKQLSEIVVSTNRRKQRVADLSVSIALIKPEYIEQNSVINADDLLNQVSGIEIMDGQASIRGGSGYSYGAGSRVLALIDGMPVLSADAGNIKWQFLPMENIESVEVIKGASSVLYGSSALNGIINFRTSSPKMNAENRFSILTGLYDEPQQKKWIWWENPRNFQNFSISHLKKYNNTDVALSAALQNNNSYRKLNNEQLIRFNARIKHYNKNKPLQKFGIALNSGYTYKTDFVLWENADSGALKQNPETASKMKGTFLSLEPFFSTQNANLKQDLRLQIQYTGNNFTEKTQNNSNAISYYGEYQLIADIDKHVNIISGVSATYSLINSKFYKNHTAQNAAVFSQIEYILRKLKLNGGVRFEYNAYDGISDKLVPVFRTGLSFKATASTFLRASFGQGYRYPSIAEKYASTTLGSIKIFPNLEIKPETGWTSELGIKQIFRLISFKGLMDLSFFYSENTNMIEYIFGIFPDIETGQMDFGFRASNIENSSVYGIEPQVSLMKNSANGSIAIDIGYTYMYPVEQNNFLNTDKYLKYRSKHSLKITNVFSYKTIRLILNSFYKSKILNIDNVFLNPATREQILPGFYDYWIENNKGYLLLDGNFAYIFNKKFELSFSVKNITNVEYMGRPGDIRSQRHFSIQFSGKF